MIYFICDLLIVFEFNLHERIISFQVLVFLGSFAVSPVLFDWAYTGGPLGELVQWSDLVTSVYMLGHDLIVTALESDLPK